jgi:hypothetical protein
MYFEVYPDSGFTKYGVGPLCMAATHSNPLLKDVCCMNPHGVFTIHQSPKHLMFQRESFITPVFTQWELCMIGGLPDRGIAGIAVNKVMGMDHRVSWLSFLLSQEDQLIDETRQIWIDNLGVQIR